MQHESIRLAFPVARGTVNVGEGVAEMLSGRASDH